MKYKKLCYREDLYLDDDIRVKAEVLECCVEWSQHLYGVQLDIYKFVDKFMHSHCVYCLDVGHPYLHGANSIDTFKSFIEIDCKGDIQQFSGGIHGCAYREFYWIGMMYAFIHYKTRIISSQIYDKLPIETMRQMYDCGHQLSEEHAFDKLKGALYD